MCGIAGVVAPEADRHARVVETMLDALGHRGPDGRRVVIRRGCVLGATRLAVIDPAHGDQPMVLEERDTAVAFNGEVYGHRRIRQELDHPFRTGCDTEVLLALHAARGPRFVEDLPGMFAYALWDGRAGQLECARDRFGEKPFFWTHGPEGEVVFASEIGALLATGWVDPVVDEVSLSAFLRHGHVPPDRTIWRDVEVLPPAHRLTVGPAGAGEPVRYWSPPAPEPGPVPDAAEQLAEVLDRAVADQLVADVPVGAFLSGGLDSASVIALATDHHPDLHTFSFGLGGPGDETAAARAQAAHLGTAHQSFGLDGAGPLTVLDEVVRVWDEPFGDASAIPTLLLSRLAREQVTVALTGDGADELLGGYLHWSRHFLADRGAPRPAALGGRGDPLADPAALVDAYRGFRCYLDDEQTTSLGLAPYRRELDWPPTGRVADLLRFDLEGYLPGDVLVKTDRASMAVGLELRSPFLDHRVAELCLRLPDEAKVDPTGDKLVLREALGDRLAPGTTARPKRGFSGPMVSWLEDPAVVERRKDLVLGEGSPLHDLLDREGLAPLAAEGGQLGWNLLVLGLWAAASPGARR